MGRRLAALRVPARIARRNALRAKGRTALVAVMVGLPIVAASTLAVLFQSSMPTDATYLRASLGEEAQARLRLTCAMGGPTVQDVRGETGGCFGSSQTEPTTAELEAAAADVLPGDLVLTPLTRGDVRLTSDSGTERYNAYGEIDLSVPGVAATVELHDGRLPTEVGEVLVGRGTAARLDIGPGDEVAVRAGRDDPRTVTVTGVMDWSSSAPVVLGLPGTVPEAVTEADQDQWGGAEWLVTGESPVTWDAVLALNELGVTVTSRAVLLDPPARDRMPFYGQGMGAYVDQRGVALGAVVVGAGLLEAVLLIGPAFAVGARRSARELALLAANGGERRDLRRVVVWSGIVIGTGASLVAAVVGTGVGLGLAAVLDEYVGGFPNLRVPWLMLAGFVVLGVLIAVTAAWLPARQASRVDVVAALSGRRSEARPHRAVPLVGVLLLGVGTAAALAGAARSSMPVTVAGVALLTLGMVAASGAIVTLVGRLAPSLPLAPRLALRDAARQRSRTAPAVAAVIAAVAGASAGAVYLAASDHHQEMGWVANAALGTVQVGLPEDGFDDQDTYVDALEELEAAVEGTVPLEGVATVRVMRAPAEAEGGPTWLGTEVAAPPENLCPLWTGESLAEPSEEELDRYRDDPRCSEFSGGTSRAVWWAGYDRPLVDDGTAIALTGLPGAAEAAAALADGAVVVNGARDLWADGTVHLTVSLTEERTQETVEQQLVLPGHVVEWENDLYRMVLPPTAVEQLTELDVEVVPVGLVAQPVRPLVDEEVAALSRAVRQVEDAEVYVEAPYPRAADYSILAVVGVAAIVGLAATWIAVGLAAAESRADLATLAAVGASPRTRRSVAGAQAGVIAGTGVALGVAAGVLLGVVFVRLQDAQSTFQGNGGWEVVVPWPALGLVLVGLPSLAVLAAMAVTRSRLPLVRRIAT